MSAGYDVAIVGAGPAGTSTALHLVRREGVPADRIVVIDKARFPRDKPCAGAVSQLGLDLLAAVGVDLAPVPSVAMRGARVLQDGAVGATALPIGACFRRTELDAHLVEAVRADGVTVLEGAGLRTLARTAEGFRLGAGEHELVVPLLGVADGAGGPTRRLLGLREADRKGHLYVLDTPLGAGDAPLRQGFVDFDLSVLADGIDGYTWDFPTPLGGVVQASRGIYHANFTRPDTPAGESLKAVLARALRRRGIDPASVTLRPFSTRPFVAASPTWVPGAALIGEACGIDQTTGEGIAQAIDMGRLAARALADARRTGARRFEGYDRALRASVTGAHLLQSAFLARRVYGRYGGPARRYLRRSGFARTAALRWYRGERLGLATELRLALGLAASIV